MDILKIATDAIGMSEEEFNRLMDKTSAKDIDAALKKHDQIEKEFVDFIAAQTKKGNESFTLFVVLMKALGYYASLCGLPSGNQLPGQLFNMGFDDHQKYKEKKNAK